MRSYIVYIYRWCSYQHRMQGMGEEHPSRSRGQARVRPFRTDDRLSGFSAAPPKRPRGGSNNCHQTI